MPSFTYAFLTEVRPDGTRAPDSSHASSSDGVESSFEVAPLACKNAGNHYSSGQTSRQNGPREGHFGTVTRPWPVAGPCCQPSRGKPAGAAAGGLSAQLPEVWLKPDLLLQVLLHPVDVAHRGSGTPAAGEPPADAAPGVPGLVLSAARHGVQPRLVAVKAGPPDPVRGVRVHRGRVDHAGPAAVLVRIAILQDPVTLRALTGLAVLAELVPGRTVGGVGAPVPLGVLLPPALHRCLREHDVLVDPPLAGGPAQDVDRGAGEIAVDPRREPLLRERVVVTLGQDREEVLAYPLPGAPVVRLVRGLDLTLAGRVDEPGALRPGRQLRARRQGMEVHGLSRRRGRPRRRRGRGQGDRRRGDQDRRCDDRDEAEAD